MSHLTYAQRYAIEMLLSCGKKQKEISDHLCVSSSTISRELNRNSDKRSGFYKAKLAHLKYNNRLFNKPKRIKFDAHLKSKVVPLLRKDYSPEQITGSLRKHYGVSISHESIYQFIWQDKKDKGDLHTHLRRKGRRYRKRGSSKDTRGCIVGRIGIEKRPKQAMDRSTFGHLEVDTIIGKNTKVLLLH